MVGIPNGGSRIFPRMVRQLPKVLLFFNIFAENCMKMKEFGPPGGGGASLAPPLDPPMLIWEILDSSLGIGVGGALGIVTCSDWQTNNSVNDLA